jgi:hypothetical protein
MLSRGERVWVLARLAEQIHKGRFWSGFQRSCVPPVIKHLPATDLASFRWHKLVALLLHRITRTSFDAPMLARAFRARFPQCTTQRKSIGLVADNKGCLEGWLKAMDEFE